jgi:transcriptional regulator with XRE-family HTH domain
MRRKRGINDAVRVKIRQLRKARGITIRELCDRIGMPIGSYGCLESGSYNITLENLHRILNVLGVDISEVWPYDEPEKVASHEASQLKKIQEFRLAEVVALAGAEGAALFARRGGKCSVILHQNISHFLIERLTLYLEDNLVYREGVWVERNWGKTTYYFFLKARGCPPFVQKLLDRYMVIWASAFTE